MSRLDSNEKEKFDDMTRKKTFCLDELLYIQRKSPLTDRGLGIRRHVQPDGIGLIL